MNSVDRSSVRYQAVLQLLRTFDTIWNASRLFFARWDLSPSQFNVLNLLRGNPNGLTQTELGRELITHRSNVTGLIDRLEGRGLVQRLEIQNDRRAYRVVLTADASRILAEIMPEYRSKAERVWGELPENRLKLLLEDLREAADNAEKLGMEEAQQLNTLNPHENESKRVGARGRGSSEGGRSPLV